MNTFPPWLANGNWLLWPPVLVLLALIFCVARGRHHFRWAWLVGGLLVFLVALEPPIDPLASGGLFSVHMVQHLLLLLIAPLLLLLALPAGNAEAKPAGKFAAAIGWSAGVGGMWLWHLPALCSAAAVNPVLHGVQAVSLVAMGLAFWRPVFSPRPSARIPPLTGLAYLFSACAACSLLGVWITFAPLSVCPAFLAPAGTLVRSQCGLDAAHDQQLGGLIMWVPACLIYFTAMMTVLARWYRDHPHPKPASIHARPSA